MHILPDMDAGTHKDQPVVSERRWTNQHAAAAGDAEGSSEPHVNICLLEKHGLSEGGRGACMEALKKFRKA